MASIIASLVVKTLMLEKSPLPLNLILLDFPSMVFPFYNIGILYVASTLCFLDYRYPFVFFVLCLFFMFIFNFFLKLKVFFSSTEPAFKIYPWKFWNLIFLFRSQNFFRRRLLTEPAFKIYPWKFSELQNIMTR